MPNLQRKSIDISNPLQTRNLQKYCLVLNKLKSGVSLYANFAMMKKDNPRPSIVSMTCDFDSIAKDTLTAGGLGGDELDNITFVA